MPETTCPQCGGEGSVLGFLGTTLHNRCRACGWIYAAEDEAPTVGSDNDLPRCRWCDSPYDREVAPEPFCAPLCQRLDRLDSLE